MGTTTHLTSVTSAEFVRHFGRWQDKVGTSPVVVTSHGRDRMVMVSMDRYQALLDAEDKQQQTPRAAGPPSAALDFIEQGFIAIDSEMRFTELNPVACAYLRVVRGEQIGRLLIDGHVDLAKTLVHANLARAVRSGEIASFDVRSLAYPDNWFRFQTFPHGSGAACLFRNLTEERETRRLSRMSTAIIASIEAHGSVGFGQLDRGGSFIRVNPALAAMLGRARGDMRDLRPGDMVAAELRVQANEQIEAVLNDGEESRAFDTVLIDAQGTRIAVRIAVIEVHDDQARNGAVIIVTPLTTVTA